MKKNITEELSRYSKAALIKAIIDNSLLQNKAILDSVKNAELDILLNKQDKIIKEINKLHPVHDYKKYKELSESYNRYSRKTDKLMGL